MDEFDDICKVLKIRNKRLSLLILQYYSIKYLYKF